MKEETKKWVEALRSGNYKQGKFNLNRNGFLCCMGVMCEIHNPNKWYEQNFGNSLVYDEDGSYTHPPPDVSKVYFPLRGNLTIANLSCTFADLNDHMEFTFEGIANVIEAIAEGHYKIQGDRIIITVGERQIKADYGSVED